MSNTEEWDIFARVEKLEKMKLDLEEVGSVAVLAFILLFINMVSVNPHNARKIKDRCIELFEKQGISAKSLKALEKKLLEICDYIEK